MTNTYSEPTYLGKQALREAMLHDDPDVLARSIVAAALHEEDREFVEDACARLSSHNNETVRGNAILGLGHLARMSRELGPQAFDVVKRGLRDESAYVRGHAHSAAADLRHFLGVEVRVSDPSLDS